MPSYLVESFVAGEDRLAEQDSRAKLAAAELCASGTVVRIERAIHLPGDQMCLYLLEAASAQDARTLAERAGIQAVRIVPVAPSEREEQ